MLYFCRKKTNPTWYDVIVNKIGTNVKKSFTTYCKLDLRVYERDIQNLPDYWS